MLCLVLDCAWFIDVINRSRICCMHIGSAVIENMFEVAPEYEEVIKECEEVLVDGVHEALLIFLLTRSRTKASPGA